jgi:hypothetical protein
MEEEKPLASLSLTHVHYVSPHLRPGKEPENQANHECLDRTPKTTFRSYLPGWPSSRKHYVLYTLPSYGQHGRSRWA